MDGSDGWIRWMDPMDGSGPVALVHFGIPDGIFSGVWGPIGWIDSFVELSKK